VTPAESEQRAREKMAIVLRGTGDPRRIHDAVEEYRSAVVMYVAHRIAATYGPEDDDSDYAEGSRDTVDAITTSLRMAEARRRPYEEGSRR
jgi:hypothetical protein